MKAGLAQTVIARVGEGIGDGPLKILRLGGAADKQEQHQYDSKMNDVSKSGLSHRNILYIPSSQSDSVSNITV